MSSVLLALALQGCSSGDSVNPGSWTCDSLIQPVIEASKGKTPEILEITEPKEMINIPNGYITCQGSAEWSEGSGTIEYGAHVSNGGDVIISYRQM
jgi:hypothetical protein